MQTTGKVRRFFVRYRQYEDGHWRYQVLDNDTDQPLSKPIRRRATLDRHVEALRQSGWKWGDE